MEMKDIREYVEGFPVELDIDRGREVVIACNDGGYNSTAIDILDLIAYLKEKRPELL